MRTLLGKIILCFAFISYSSSSFCQVKKMDEPQWLINVNAGYSMPIKSNRLNNDHRYIRELLIENDTVVGLAVNRKTLGGQGYRLNANFQYLKPSGWFHSLGVDFFYHTPHSGYAVISVSPRYIPESHRIESHYFLPSHYTTLSHYYAMVCFDLGTGYEWIRPNYWNFGIEGVFKIGGSWERSLYRGRFSFYDENSNVITHEPSIKQNKALYSRFPNVIGLQLNFYGAFPLKKNLEFTTVISSIFAINTITTLFPDNDRDPFKYRFTLGDGEVVKYDSWNDLPYHPAMTTNPLHFPIGAIIHNIGLSVGIRYWIDRK